MKKYNPILSMKLLFLTLSLLSLCGFAQIEKPIYTIGLANVTNTATSIEMDVIVTIDNPTNRTKLSQLSVGVNYNTSILNNGNPCDTKNCGSWTYIGGKSSAIAGLLTTFNTTTSDYGHLRIVGTPLDFNNAITVANGSFTLGRYKFTNSVPWTKNSNAQLWLQPTNQGNKTNTILSTFPNEFSRKLVANTTVFNRNSKIISLQYTSDSPLNYILNSKVEANANFNAIAYPNPYKDNFNIEVETTIENTIQIKVYDMLGKLIESKNTTSNEIKDLSIGANYPVGVYNVNVSQEGNNKTIRIIKR